MPAIAVIGAQWGDEGKGKVVDMLAEKADVVIRFSGGDNAGHTIVNHFGEFRLHLVPSGIFSPSAVCIIGNGVAVNPAVVVEEVRQLNQSGVDTSRLCISDRANLIMPYHVLLDGLEEKMRGGKALGTTGKGIGPVFSDKAARLGIRTGDLLDRDAFRQRLSHVLEIKNRLLTRIYEASPLDFDGVYAQYCKFGEQLARYIRETSGLAEKALDNNEMVVLEGAQGALLDPDFGTYPFTTSSSPLAGEACLGAGIGPTRISCVLAVFKAYCTRVGGGPFPTEMKDATGNMIRERAREYGATTGRPRRCGWFDAVAGRFSTRINGFTAASLTRLDILDVLPTLKICTAYELEGKTIHEFPASTAALERCKPVYEELPGWQCPTTDIRSYDDLPREAKQYIARLEELIACPMKIICVGPERAQTIHRMPLV